MEEIIDLCSDDSNYSILNNKEDIITNTNEIKLFEERNASNENDYFIPDKNCPDYRDYEKTIKEKEIKTPSECFKSSKKCNDKIICKENQIIISDSILNSLEKRNYINFKSFIPKTNSFEKIYFPLKRKKGWNLLIITKKFTVNGKNYLNTIIELCNKKCKLPNGLRQTFINFISKLYPEINSNIHTIFCFEFEQVNNDEIFKIVLSKIANNKFECREDIEHLLEN